MKILLIYPPFPYGKGMSAVLCSAPLNLLTLAGSVPDHEIEILDLNVDLSYGVKELEEKLSQFDLIGVTCMSTGLNNALKICQIAKKINVPTILGGFHPTLEPTVIEKFDCIDMIVRGEGDFTFKEILDGKPKKEILGLSYRENGKVYHNPDRPYIKNLDDLPFPRNDLIKSKPYHYLWIPSWVCETSRGCPFNCSFCCVTKFYKRTYRMKSPERVIKELFLIPPKTKLVLFVDDNFTLNKKRVMRICELLQKTRLNRNLLFVCQSRVDDIANNPDMVKEMRKSGFICVFIGFESFKQMALDRMEKEYTLDKVHKCIEICHQNGIFVFASFIIGNIGETISDTRKTFSLIKKLEIDFIMANPLTPFPGTDLHKEAVEKGWVASDYRWESNKTGSGEPAMCTPDLTIENIRDLLFESYDSFYGDTKYLFNKLVIKLLQNPEFKWTRKYSFRFFKNGITKFMFNKDKIIGEEG